MLNEGFHCGRVDGCSSREGGGRKGTLTCRTGRQGAEGRGGRTGATGPRGRDGRESR